MHQIINEPIHILENPYLCIDLLLNLTGKFFDIFGILLPFTKGRPLQRGVSLRFFNSPKKKGFQIFLLKKEEFVKQGNCSKKRGTSLFSTLLTHSNLIFLGVCFSYVHHFYQHPLCLSGRTGLVYSNQEICDFCKLLSFEKQGHFRHVA